MNTGAIHNPDLIRQGAQAFGSQCIVSYIEAKYINGRYEAMTDNGREVTGKDVFDWAKQVVDLGAGEILLTSIDNEGTGLGYDLQLIRNVAEQVPVQVIASGGCGKAEHIQEAVKTGKADAINAASVFHYNYLDHTVKTDEFNEEGNIEFIKQNRGGLGFMKNRISRLSIQDVKQTLVASGIKCRVKWSN